MVRDGFFYAVGLGVVATLVWLLTQSVAWTSLPVLLAVFFLWFFRDPERRIPAGPGDIVSPGDGVVTEADWIETAAGSRFRMSIFLNVFDVHVNRAPVAGTVKVVEHREGSFLNAMKPESVVMNEQTLVVIDAGGAAEDAADGPGGIFAREEDFADALFFRAVAPAAQQREVVGEGGEVGWGGGLSFERGDEVGGAEFGAEGGSGCGGGRRGRNRHLSFEM